MKKPLVLSAIQLLCAVFFIGNALTLLNAALTIQIAPSSSLIGTIAISFAVAWASAHIFLGIRKHTFTSRLPISAYLWFLLLVYPATNILRTYGYYLPAPEIPSNQLAGAAFAELLRYLIPLPLIVWVGFSKRLKQHLTTDPSPNELAQ